MSAEDRIEPADGAPPPAAAAAGAPSPAPTQPARPADSAWAFARLKSVQLVAVGLVGVVFGAVLATGVALALSHGGHRGHGPFDGPGRFDRGDHGRFESDQNRPWHPNRGDGFRLEPRN